MKVAMPVWEGRISPVFDAARRLMVVDVIQDMEIKRREVPLGGVSPLYRVRRMADLGVDVLICGGISRSYVDLMDAFTIAVVPWITGEPEQILTAYLRGDLPSLQFAMPGH